MKYLKFLILAILVSACFGEVKEEPKVSTADYKDIAAIIKKRDISIDELEPTFTHDDVSSDESIALDEDFKITGHYGPESCRVKIYRKEYIESYLYIHEDCRGNRTKQIVRK